MNAIPKLAIYTYKPPKSPYMGIRKMITGTL